MSRQLINVVLDLETLGTDEDAAIIQIGMCVPRFDRKYLPLDVPCELGVAIAYEECLAFIEEKTFTLSDETMLWWEKQDSRVRKIVFSGQSTYADAFDEVESFLDTVKSGGGDIAVWGSGSDFDNRLLAHSMCALGYKPTWSFRNNRDLRTLKALCPLQSDVLDFRFTDEIKHTALGDARYEARVLGYIKDAYSGLYLI